MKTFILAMVLHPEVYRKAQAEIDHVIGPDRLPDFEDREQLPYLDCVLREVFRCVGQCTLSNRRRSSFLDAFFLSLPAGTPRCHSVRP